MKSIPIIKCRNLERSIEFYTKTLGFQFKDTTSQPSGPVVRLVRDTAELELSVLAGDSVFGAAVYLAVGNVDELFREFLLRGLDRPSNPDSPVHQAPLDQTWGMREFYVTDPDGNTLRFRTPIDNRRLASDSSGMTDNLRTVGRYMDAFRRNDHEHILSCLTDDVEWLVPGAFHVSGKPAFDREIEGEGFVRPPLIEVTRMLEASDVVFAEGFVRTERADGTRLHLAMCDAFEMRGGRIRRLTSYLMPVST